MRVAHRPGEPFAKALDAFLSGRPWTGPIPEGDHLLAVMRRPDDALAALLRRHAAARLAAVDLAFDDGARIGGDVVLPLAGAVHLDQLSLGPEGLDDLAATCARLADERGLARNLAEDALCSLAAARLPRPLGGDGGGRHGVAPDSEETVRTLRRLSPWSLLDGDLDELDDEEARTVGEWLSRRVLPASRPGRFPLRKLLLRPLVTASEVRDPLPLLAALARILAHVGADGPVVHLVDLYECYCGWKETRGPCDADARRVLQRLDLRDVESERRQEGVAAGAFFVLLTRLEPAAVRKAPRLHRELLQASRQISRRLPEVTS